jgi:hypothetical protein
VSVLSSASAPAVPAQAPADLEDITPTEKIQTLMERVQEFRARHEKWEMAGFFFVGFVYDVLTLSRIDDRLTMVQQFVYLLVLATLLLLEQRHPEGTEPPKLLAKAWRWREDAIHFFYGSLLSSFTLFFFKSASGFTALLFLVVMFGLLVANELPRFRKLGPVVRVALFSLCVSMYLAYVLPVIIGRMNFWVFLLAQVLTGGGVYGLMRLLRRWNILEQRAILRQIAIPGFGMLVVLMALYMARVLPPVPLVAMFSGIYHKVDSRPGVGGKEYLLYHERPWWKFWHRGDQDFLLREGDKAWYFFSVFSPKGFRDYQVVVRWYYDHPQRGWVDRGRFNWTVRYSGEERGSRSFASKTVEPGDWLVVLETDEGHEINRLSFTVEKDESTEPREFKLDVHKLKDEAPKKEQK